MTKGFAALTAALVSLAASAVPAMAENPFARDAIVLNLKGVDLSTAQGQQRLAIRLDQAARSVCGEGMASIHIALGEQARACRAQVVADIRSQVEARNALNGGSTPHLTASR